jgi:peroxiredoxin
MKKLISAVFTLFIAFVALAQTNETKLEGLKVGDKAPDFTAINQAGEKIMLNKLLEKGDVVLVFYRGQWCPYCNKYISKLNDSLASISAKGATVVTVTPETEENVLKTVKKTNASFSIISDKDLVIMKSYKVSFAVDEKTIEKYKGYGIDFEKANGKNGANLPVPATYIIGKNGMIKYSFFNPDYSKRASVNDILANL